MSQPFSDETQDNFNTYLDAAITTGTRPGSGLGFNTEIVQALLVVADEFPSPTATSIQNAQQCWRRYASGATRAEASAIADGIAARWKV